MSDLQHACRQLFRHPFTNTVIVLTIALFIGAIGVVYATIRGNENRFRPFPEPDRMVKLWRAGETRNSPHFSADLFHAYAQRLSSIENIGAVERLPSLTLTEVGEPVSYEAVAVTPELLQAGALPPIAGRLFDATDAKRKNDRLILISEQMWREKLGAAEEVIGGELRLNGELLTVIGVLPKSMQSTSLAYNTDIWRLQTFADADSKGPYLQVFGRLSPTANFEQAQAELATVAPPLEEEFATAGNDRPELKFHDALIGPINKNLGATAPRIDAAAILEGVFVFLLLGSVPGIACFNVTNLLLARVSARSRELAIRLSIGAGRWRIVRQFITETVLLALIGGVFGLLVSFWFAKGLSRQGINVRMDWGLYLVATGSAVGLGILVGLLPALRSAKTDLTEALKDGGPSVGRRRHRLRNFLVTSQIAMALILVMMAGLVTRSYLAMLSPELGFNPDRVVSVNASLRTDTYQDMADRIAFMDHGLQTLQQVPGVEIAAVTLGGGRFESILNGPIKIAATSDRPAQRADTDILYGSADVRKVLGRNLIRGRDLSTAPDQAKQEALINEAFAAKFFPDTDPLGKRFHHHIIRNASEVGKPRTAPGFTIVGVIGNRHPLTTHHAIGPEVLLSHWSVTYQADVMFLAQTRANAKVMAQPIREALLSVDANQPINQAVFLADILERRANEPRSTVLVLMIFAGVGLFIALMGVYGVVAFTVQERTREIGIRIAVGATPSLAQRPMLWLGARLLLIGAIPGMLIGSLALASVPNEGLTPGVSAFDLPTYLATFLIVGAAGFLACLLPARKAANLNPMEALRHE